MKMIHQLGALAIISSVPLGAAAQAINVELSRTASLAPLVTTVNSPITISGPTADIADSGTIWNSLICPTNATANSSGSQLTFTVSQNLPLVDSGGNASSVSISSIQFSENNGKTDTIHNTGMVSEPIRDQDRVVLQPHGLDEPKLVR